MSGITLSSSVRQNLLSLQSTADLLSTTQNRLSTGNKVNSALDNPTNFFTASSLNSRSSDINNLLDGIGNGVQILQAANTGITSLQKLVDSAKSIANQALQTTVGYAKSNATSAASGATASDLLGTTAQVTTTVTGTSVLNNNTQTYSPTAGTAGAAISTAAVAGKLVGTAIPGATAGTDALSSLTTPPGINGTISVGASTFTIVAAGTASTATTISLDDSLDDVAAKLSTVAGVTASFASGALTLSAAAGSSLPTVSGTALASLGLSGTPTAGAAAAPIAGTTLLSALPTALTTTDTLVVNGKTISFSSTTGNSGTAAGGDLNFDLSTATVADVLAGINATTGGTSAINATTGAITLSTGTGANIVTSGSGFASLGLPTASTTITRTSAPATAAAITGATLLKGATGTDSLSFAAGDTITVNGKNIGFYDSSTGGTDPGGTDTINFDLATATVSDVLGQIDAYSGGTGSLVDGGKVKLNAGTTADLTLGGNALGKLGLTAAAGAHAKSAPASAGLTGLTLTIGSTGGGTATNITFGAGTGEVNTLDELNAALATNNLQASVSSTGEIKLTTTNDAASSDIGTISGTATAAGAPFAATTVTNAVKDVASQATRASLIAQYNQVIDQITTTAQDSSFNGVNLLNGDTLKLTFNETGSSKLSISGVGFGPGGLGLSSLTAGTDFTDNAATNKVLSSLTAASNTLRSQASSFGSNLSVVQIRQDFSKSLINVLQTGASNLTLADTNEEAANSQALSTRQSIAVSSLALANTAQQGVLQLLR